MSFKNLLRTFLYILKSLKRMPRSRVTYKHMYRCTNMVQLISRPAERQINKSFIVNYLDCIFKYKHNGLQRWLVLKVPNTFLKLIPGNSRTFLWFSRTYFKILGSIFIWFLLLSRLFIGFHEKSFFKVQFQYGHLRFQPGQSFQVILISCEVLIPWCIVRICLLKFPALLNFLSHCRNSNSLILWCTDRICLFKLPASVNFFSHCWHSNSFTPWCTVRI